MKEKVLAAHRAGVQQVILPAENEKNLVKVPEKVREELEFVFAERIPDATSVALEQERTEKPEHSRFPTAKTA